jgi:CBS domain-containing protein
MNLKSCLVRDYMAGHLVTFKPDMEVMDAIHELVKQRIAGAPVVDDKGDLVGMLSELDCMKVALNAGYYGDWGGPVAAQEQPPGRSDQPARRTARTQ